MLRDSGSFSVETSRDTVGMELAMLGLFPGSDVLWPASGVGGGGVCFWSLVSLSSTLMSLISAGLEVDELKSGASVLWRTKDREDTSGVGSSVVVTGSGNSWAQEPMRKRRRRSEVISIATGLCEWVLGPEVGKLEAQKHEDGGDLPTSPPSCPLPCKRPGLACGLTTFFQAHFLSNQKEQGRKADCPHPPPTPSLHPWGPRPQELELKQ